MSEYINSSVFQYFDVSIGMFLYFLSLGGLRATHGALQSTIGKTPSANLSPDDLDGNMLATANQDTR